MSILFYDCTTAKSATAPTKQTFTFSYKTSHTVAPNSSDMVLALVRPYYANNFAYSNNEIFKSFRQYMGDDVNQLLNDKGFRLMNKTYYSLDEMTYDDKKTTDIVLIITLNADFKAGGGQGWLSHRPFSLNQYSLPPLEWQFNGTVSLSPHLTIVGMEPLTGQKLFTKSLEVPSIENISIITSRNLPSNEFNESFFNDPSVYNALGTTLQASYTNCLQQMDTYIDPREIANYKSEVQELRSKKVYN
jgi:hypothetical protein